MKKLNMRKMAGLATVGVLALPCPATATLYNIQLNGRPDITFYGSGQTGGADDVWNNPDWAGVASGSTTLFPEVSLVDSKGAEGRVKASLTAAYNTNTNDWNDGGVFNRYEGRDDGSATPGLMDLVVKVDYNKVTVNVMTLTLTGLPRSAAVTVYVYGCGRGTGTGGLWSLAEANGGSSAAILYDAASPNAETGRDVRLATSKGLSWESLSGKTDASGKLILIATGPPKSQGAIWWQTYMNGVQVEVGK